MRWLTQAGKAALDAKLALEPVSIYISRATQKLYVRRNTHKPLPDAGVMFDATIEVPVTIRDPGKRIGTHVFTAVARDVVQLMDALPPLARDVFGSYRTSMSAPSTSRGNVGVVQGSVAGLVCFRCQTCAEPPLSQKSGLIAGSVSVTSKWK